MQLMTFLATTNCFKLYQSGLISFEIIVMQDKIGNPSVTVRGKGGEFHKSVYLCEMLSTCSL